MFHQLNNETKCPYYTLCLKIIQDKGELLLQITVYTLFEELLSYEMKHPSNAVTIYTFFMGYLPDSLFNWAVLKLLQYAARR
jgi:hypothetical protein